MRDDTAAVPGPTPASAPSSTPKRRSRATALVGQVVGIVGMVVCLALIVGVLLGRSWVTGAVADVAASLDAAVARTDPLLAAAGAGVDAVAQRAGEAAAAAEAVAAAPRSTPQALQGVADRLTAVSERYLELRNAYAGAREQVVSAINRLAVIDRLVPGLAVPQGPIDALAGLDEKVRALDSRVMGLIGAASSVGDDRVVATSIAEKARAVEAGLAPVTAAVADVQGRLADLRTRIAVLADRVGTLTTIGSLGLIVLLLYGALLHLVLFRWSRRLA